MRAKTLQIVWHGNQAPVFSIDFNRGGVLASAGGDKEIKLWKVHRDSTGDPAVQHIGNIKDPSMTTVNCVRWSPTGKLLASGGDRGSVLVWCEPENAAEPKAAFGDDPDDKPTKWRIKQNYKGHTDDVQDISWAPDGTAFATASVDNNCIVWDAYSKNPIIRFDNHKHYVQGIAWDPAGTTIVSLSADRTCRIYAPKPPAAGKKAGRVPANAGTCAAAAKDLYCQHVLTKRTINTGGDENAPDGGAGRERHFMFCDDTLLTFFRRLSWSPDGALVVVPGASYKADTSSEAIHASYVFSRSGWNTPAMVLPAIHKPAVVVRFCPRLFRRRHPLDTLSTAPRAISTPYRMVFAIATIDSIILYDTELAAPFALLGGLHFAAITDLAWSTDGQFLVASSRDGYCSVVAFEDGELGEMIPNNELQAPIATRMIAAQKRIKPLDTTSAKPTPAAVHAPPTTAPTPVASGTTPIAPPAAAAPSTSGAPSVATAAAVHGATPLPAGGPLVGGPSVQGAGATAQPPAASVPVGVLQQQRQGQQVAQHHAAVSGETGEEGVLASKNNNNSNNNNSSSKRRIVPMAVGCPAVALSAGETPGKGATGEGMVGQGGTETPTAVVPTAAAAATTTMDGSQGKRRIVPQKM